MHGVTLTLCGALFCVHRYSANLSYGAVKSAKAAGNMLTLSGLVRTCELYPTDLGTSETDARLKLDLHRKGKPIPENDIWIASHSLQHDLPLLTLDAHFQEIESLQQRRW